MPTSLPIVRGTSAALYPFQQTFTAQTMISDGENGAATRTILGPPLVSFEIPTSRITKTKKDTLKSFFTSAKGQFTTDLRITTYQNWDNLSFDDDEFAAAEQVSTQYGLAWKLTQTLPVNYGAGTSGTAYPAWTNGAISKLPFIQKKRFDTVVSKMPSGPKYTFARYSGGLARFPTDGLMGWELHQVNLLDSEVNTLLAHWLANWGDALPFTFTDEDGITYSKVYYGSPEFKITWRGKNHSDIVTSLIQTF